MVPGEWPQMSDVIDFLKDYRVIILVVLLIGSLAAISMYGVSEDWI